MRVFGQDPQHYLRELEIEIPSYFDESRPALLDDAHRAKERERFLKDPPQWCGWVTDPVARERFCPGKDAPRSDYAGRIFYFESDSTQAVFAAKPDSFAAPRMDMVMGR